MSADGTSAPPVVTARGITKSVGPRVLLADVEVIVREGEHVGLVGRNGAGKSTLARILAGIEAPEGGSIARRRGAEVLYLEQDPSLDPDATPRSIVTSGLAAWSQARARHEAATAALATATSDADAILAEQAAAAADVERLGGWSADHAAMAMLERLGVPDPDRAAGTLSGGERRRVALARILVARPEMAILDEPTNHLDVETIAWLETYLAEEFPGAFLLVTHDRFLLDRVCTRTLELARSTVASYDGGYGAYLEAKAEREMLEARTESNRQNFLRKEIEWLRRQPKARSTKQKGRIQRAEAAKAAGPPPKELRAVLEAEAVRSGKSILDLRDVAIDVPGGRRLIDDLTLSMVSGERLAIVGRNGTGKTTLIRAILGEIEPAAGQLTLGHNAKVAYFDQHRGDLDDAASVYDNVAMNRAVVEIGTQRIEIRAWLERFLFEKDKQRQPVGSLSGGERARVALAKLLSVPSNIVILDEPTNDLDVETLSALEDLLCEWSGCAIVVTHDRWFLDRVATGVLYLPGDGRAVKLAGGSEAAVAFAEHEREAHAERAKEEKSAVQKASAPPPPGAAAATKKKLSFAELRELEGLLEKIEAEEARVGELEATLADPAIYKDRGGEVPALRAELERAKATAEASMARWEELESRR